MNDRPHLCVECAHCFTPSLPFPPPACRAPQNLHLDLVTGESNARYQTCRSAREGGSDRCGVAALWFVPLVEKRAWWAKLIGPNHRAPKPPREGDTVQISGLTGSAARFNGEHVVKLAPLSRER